MTWTLDQQNYALYTIGTVESGLDYGACNLNDAITLGIVQWWGANAAGLLEHLQSEAPAAFELVSQNLKDTLAAHPSSEYNFWSNFYLSNADAQAWKTSAADPANQTTQNNYFYSYGFGSSGAAETLAGWGAYEGNPQTFLLLLSAYWQRPQSALNIISNIGGNRTLDQTLTAILADPILGNYSNRYNRVAQLCREWDGTSAPAAWTPTTSLVPNNPNTDGQARSIIKYIRLINNEMLLLYGQFVTGDKLLCYPTGNGIWLPCRNEAGNPYPSTTPGEPGDPADWPAMKQLWIDNEGAFEYMQGAGRLSPDVSGHTDCSACIWWAANKATNNKYEWLGTSTYTMRDTATFIWESSNGSIDISVMQPGDLIIMMYNNGLEHVDWYWGNNEAWGAGGDPCPVPVTSHVDTYYTGAVQWLSIWRFL